MGRLWSDLGPIKKIDCNWKSPVERFSSWWTKIWSEAAHSYCKTLIALEGEGCAGVDADQGVVFGASLRWVACQNWVSRKWFSVPGQLPLANQSSASHYNFHPGSSPSWPKAAPSSPWWWRSVNFDTKLPPFSEPGLSAPLPSAEYAFSSLLLSI